MSIINFLTCMDLKTEKIELFKLLLDTNNEKLLKKVKALLIHEKKAGKDRSAVKAGKKPDAQIEFPRGEEISISAEALWE